MTSAHELLPRFLTAALATSSLLTASVLAPALVPPAVAATTVPTTSHAGADQRIVHHDARRDVRRYDVWAETSRPAPHDRATDITTTVVDHQSDRLVIQAQARRLSRSDYRLMVAEILVSGGRRFNLVVDYSTKPIDTRVRLERFSSSRTVKCAGASWTVSRRTDRVSASIPSSCLGEPAWVRVGVALTAAPRNLRSSWADDSRARGRVGDRHLQLGPRQYAG